MHLPLLSAVLPVLFYLTMASRASALANATVDRLYPGTAVKRMEAIRDRVRSLSSTTDLSSDWDSITRPKLLWAAGLKDLRSARPGQGYTGQRRTAQRQRLHVD